MWGMNAVLVCTWGGHNLSFILQFGESAAIPRDLLTAKSIKMRSRYPRALSLKSREE